MTQATARDVFRTAYENRYTWDAQFPGYVADLEIRQNDETYTGQVRVGPDLGVEVTGIEDEKVRESAYNQMRDIITHRKRADFEQAHGKNQFDFGDTDATGAVEILVNGDAMGSNYKVRERHICYVSRVMGPMAFAINTQDVLDTGSGYIATHYNAVFRNSKTEELKGKSDFEETYESVGGYYLPVRQVVHSLDKDGQKTTTEFAFSNVRLLEPAAV